MLLIYVYLGIYGTIIFKKNHNVEKMLQFLKKIYVILTRFFKTAKSERERCPSGLRSTPGKCVYSKRVSRVRIPLSPQKVRY